MIKIKKTALLIISLAAGLSFAYANNNVQNSASNTIPSKVIQIYNNSPETIYPVIETSESQQDMWLQAYFSTTNVAQDTFTHTKVYRIYVNPHFGIPPNGTVSITLPFYSQLANNPSASAPDQYIDWWNGARVYLYDNQQNLMLAYNHDNANLVSPTTAAPSFASCQLGSARCEALSIYSNTVGLPLNDPYQLAEYTFGGIGNPNVVPYQWSQQDVDYDLSYVDHVYLPVALEPVNNKSIGYTGTVMDFGTFENRIGQFVNNSSWPTFIQTPQYTNLRVPGTYNLLVLGDANLSHTSTEIQSLEKLWTGCLNPQYATYNTQVCQNIQLVNTLFQKNYNNYLATCSSPQSANAIMPLLQHVYGWVPFTECSGFNPGANALDQTPGVDYNAAKKAYDELEYSGAFNPYVQFIHGSQYLNMPTSYAYSVDDAVGNMNEQGDGLVIAIGGQNGLPNPQPFNPNAVVRVNLGWPATGSSDPSWVKYSICSDTADQPLVNGSRSFQINSVSYPCEVTLQSSDNKPYHFYLTQSAPLSQNNLNCNASDAWCEAINMDANTKQDVDTPPPSSQVTPPPASAANLYLPAGWSSAQGCGINPTPAGSINNGGALPFQFGAAAGNCTVALTAETGAVANILVGHDAEGNVSAATCTVASTGNPCGIANLPFSAAAVNVAPPSAQIGN